MKKSIGLISVISLAVFSFLATAVSTIAWFGTQMELETDEFYGESEGAYFAYGKGTEQEPFGINKPRHLYNLSWLQMRGYFNNKDKDEDGVNDTFYFELDPNLENGILDGKNSSNVNMAIPPIGTEDNPFYGNFNGNGVIISNFTISANISDFNQKPYNATEFYETPEIVGLFGVVGSLPDSTYSYSSSTNSIYNLGITDIEIKTLAQTSLVGVVAGYVNGKLENVAVNKATINVNAATTTSTSYTNNISDYAIVGHCTKNYSEVEDPINDYYDKKDITKNTFQIFNVATEEYDQFDAHEEGEDTGSGSSINMKEMYDNLHINWLNYVNNPNTYKATYTTGTRIITREKDGKITENQAYGTSNYYNNFSVDEETAYYTAGTNYHSFFNHTQKNANNTQTASYGIVIENARSNAIGTNEERYMCITGGREIELSTGTDRRTTTDIRTTLTTNYYDSYNGHYISYGSNYLTMNNTTTFNATTTNGASLWLLENGRIFTTNTDETDIYYLNCSADGTLSVSTTANTTWTRNATTKYITATVSGTTYYLGFNGTRWTTTTYNATDDDYYLIYSGTHYMTHNGDNNLNAVTDTNSSSEPNATTVRWYKNGNNFSPTSTSTRGLRIYRSNYGNISIRVNATTNTQYTAVTVSQFSNGTYTATLSSVNNSTTYYIRYYNSWTTTTTSTNLNIKHVVVTQGFTNDIHAGDIIYSSDTKLFYQKQQSTERENAKLTINDTYFPLKGTVSNNGANLEVKDSNTGYVVGGANYRTSTDPYGDIRVSRFNKSSLSNSYSDSEFSTIYTIGNATVDLSTGKYTANGSTKTYEKFINSRDQLLNTLNSDANYIYGLHFMNAEIDKDKTIKAPYVKVADKNKEEIGDGLAYTEYNEFEMPEDSIDFHFKENGYINFFAGTFYNGAAGWNNTFFSLHQIERYKDGDTTIPEGKKVGDIKDIKEIEYVYDNTGSDKTDIPYVYRYTDGSYSKSTHGSTAIFQMSWITNPTIGTNQRNAAYYFEIPAIKGEYALGSVNGKAGSYLMYLDLAANANKLARTSFGEHSIFKQEVYDYPLGVAFVNSITKNNGVIVMDATDSGNVVIKNGYNGTVEIQRTSATAMTAAISNSSQKGNIGAGYVKETISLTDGSSAFNNAPRETITKETKRLQLLDYGVNTLFLTRTLIEEVVTTHSYTDGTATSTDTSFTMKQYVYNTDGSLKEEITDESKIKIYNPDNNGQPFTDPKNDAWELLTTTDSEIFKFKFTSNYGTVVSINFDLNYSLKTGEYYYKVDGYNVIVTVTGENIVLTIVTKSGSYTFTINGSNINGTTFPVNAQ